MNLFRLVKCVTEISSINNWFRKFSNEVKACLTTSLDQKQKKTKKLKSERSLLLSCDEFFEQVEQSSDYRRVLARTCTHFCTFFCSFVLLLLKSSSDSHTFLFQTLIYGNLVKTILHDFNLCVTDGRTDKQMDGQMDGPTDGQTDGQTDPFFYRDARTHLMIDKKWI